MVATLLDGAAFAAEIKSDLAHRVAHLKERGVTPGLGTILVGDDPGSLAYVNGKHRDCAEVGITSIRRELPANTSEADILTAVAELNGDTACTGFIVQLPLPSHVDASLVLEAVAPGKDADGLHPTNLGRLVLGKPAPLPCTPRAIIALLKRNGINLNGANVVVVGRGITVGRPLGLLLTRKSENATVTLTHTGTRDLADHLKRADIVIAAAGVAGMVTAEMIRPGITVVDVGISRTELGLVGDVSPEVSEVAGFLAPVPGGVGPVTRAMLLTNVVEAAGG